MEFLNTSKNSANANEITREFNTLLGELREQKEAQSATVMAKINQIVEYIRKRNAETHTYIQSELQRLQALKEEMNKKQVENSCQTTHDFVGEVRNLQMRL